MATPQLALDGSRLRLNTTTRLRWYAVIGQAFTVIAIAFGFRFSIPLLECLGVIVLSGLLNVILTLKYPRTLRLESHYAILLLGFDIVQLSALLYLTGGLENPFVFLLVVPVAISASTQSWPATMLLAWSAVGIATALAWYHMPLPWAGEAPPVLPFNYMVGVWGAVVSSIFFVAVYAWRIGQEARQMAQALTAAELVLAREQRLSALDGLAAAAAHQLGTPLSTIAVVVKELEREIPKDSPLHDDVVLLQSQAARCRDILSELASSGRDNPEDLMFSEMPLSHILEEVVAPLRTSGIDISVKIINQAPPAKPVGEPMLRRNPGLIHSLENLVENAVDFAKEKVSIEAKYDHNSVRLKISDDGPGFHPTILSELGEPYVTSRPQRTKDQEEVGMGLGFFIAKTILERSGATITISNKPLPETGAVLSVLWPRDRLETG